MNLMLMQNLGGQTKSIMVFSEVAYWIKSSIFISTSEALRSCKTESPSPQIRMPEEAHSFTIAVLRVCQLNLKHVIEDSAFS